MKKTLTIIVLILLNTFSSNAQQLAVGETLNYINKTLKDNPYGNSRFVVKLSSDGYLDIIRQFNSYDKYLNKCKMHFSEITVSKFSNGSPLDVRFYCKSDSENLFSRPSCMSCKGAYKNGSENWFRIMNNDKYINDKIFNAFSYLLSAIQESNKYDRTDDDPFAPQNFNKNSSSISGLKTSEKIKLETYGGVFKVWVKIGKVNQHFILDSGASDISLSKSSERKLIEKGAIKREDYIEPALYKLADGSIIKCRRVILQEMTIGGFKLKNIRASIGVSDSPLLLGRSFLDKFRKWSVDNSTNELHLEN